MVNKTLTTLATPTLAVVLSAGLPMSANTQPDSQSDRSAGQHTQQSGTHKSQQHTDMYRFVKLSTLLDSDIKSTNDETLASLDALIIDRGSGRVHFVAVTAGDVFGIGGERYAIPYDDFRFSINEGEFVLDVDEDQMDDYGDTPPVGWTPLESGDIEGDLPTLESGLGVHYGVDIDSLRAATDGGETQAISGTIRATGTYTSPSSVQYRTITVDRDDNERVDILTAPTWFLSDQDIRLERDLQVDIKAVALSNTSQGRFAAANISTDEGELALWNDGNAAWDHRDDTGSSGSLRSLMSASELIDADVFAEGEQTGEIDDAVIEIRSGFVGMLLLDPNTNLFGIGDDLKCLPWSIVTTSGDDIYADASIDMLTECEAMPDDLTVWAAPASLMPVYRVFEIETYVFPPRDAEGDTTPTNHVPLNGVRSDDSPETGDREQDVTTGG